MPTEETSGIYIFDALAGSMLSKARLPTCHVLRPNRTNKLDTKSPVCRALWGQTLHGRPILSFSFLPANSLHYCTKGAPDPSSPISHSGLEQAPTLMLRAQLPRTASLTRVLHGRRPLRSFVGTLPLSPIPPIRLASLFPDFF